METIDEDLLTDAYWDSLPQDFRLPPEMELGAEKLITSRERETIFATSGSATGPKLVCLSRAALLASAKIVNQHLSVTEDDRWLCALPTFHVGGFGIWARAYLSGSSVVSRKAAWDVHSFVQSCAKEQITLISLVPTQVFDLVQAKLRCPPTVRVVVVGGGALNDDVGNEARKLGWPVLQSYGMTEAGSQIATQSLATLDTVFSNRRIEVLPSWNVRESSCGRLEISGAALFSGYLRMDGEFVPAGSWFRTDDMGETDGAFVTVAGRGNRTVKVSGELVNLDRLEARLHALAGDDADNVALIARADPRAGHRLVLVSEGSFDPQPVLQKLDSDSKPFEQVRDLARIDVLPRSELGKVQRGRLLESIQIVETRW